MWWGDEEGNPDCLSSCFGEESGTIDDIDIYASAVSLCHWFFSFFSLLLLYHPLSFDPYTLNYHCSTLFLLIPHPTLLSCCSLRTLLPSLPLSRQVFWGQEHLNCLKLVEEHLQSYLDLQRGDLADSCSKGKACHTQPPPSPGSPSPRTEHSSDDLRTGHFQYLQDSGKCLDSACWSHAEMTRGLIV